MNILIDKLPTEYNGLKINTNFRSFILFELLMQDKDFTQEEKVLMSLNLFYTGEIKDIKGAMDGILWFYTGGIEDKNDKKQGNNSNKKRIYSYEYDAEYIFSAFLDQYGVDLNEIDYLHWWKFKAMFKSLKNDNKIVEIMGYRAVDISKIKNKDEQNKYKKLQIEYALPDNRTEAEKERDFANSLW